MRLKGRYNIIHMPMRIYLCGEIQRASPHAIHDEFEQPLLRRIKRNSRVEVAAIMISLHGDGLLPIIKRPCQNNLGSSLPPLKFVKHKRFMMNNIVWRRRKSTRWLNSNICVVMKPVIYKYHPVFCF